MVASAFAPHTSFAGVNVAVGIGLPLPSLIIAEPPPLVVIPDRYVYFVPGLDVDIFFYRGYWYRPHGGRWYRSGGYNGPWTYVARRRVPSVVVSLPPDYRHAVTVRGGHIPYGQFRKNWRNWEREDHWGDHRHGGHAYGEHSRRYRDRD